MVASGQRVGVIDEGLKPFRKGIGLRGSPWRHLRFIITLRKPRRNVLRDGHWDRAHAVCRRVDDADAPLANDFVDLELIEPSARGQSTGSGCEAAASPSVVRCSGCWICGTVRHKNWIQLGPGRFGQGPRGSRKIVSDGDGRGKLDRNEAPLQIKSALPGLVCWRLACSDVT